MGRRHVYRAPSYRPWAKRLIRSKFLVSVPPTPPPPSFTDGTAPVIRRLRQSSTTTASITQDKGP